MMQNVSRAEMGFLAILQIHLWGWR